MTWQVRRLLAAVFAIAMLFVLLWAMGRVDPKELRGGSLAHVQSDTTSRLSDYYAWEGDFTAELFNRVSGIPDWEELPSGFAEEVVCPNECDGAVPYAASGIVGLCWQRPDGASCLKRELARNGWQRIGVTDQGSSYVKNTGEYRWINVAVYMAGDCSSAVITYERRSKEHG